ncbi:hypothetical protein BDR26DRAFT_805685, partial [Obelidium mucronatum]
GVTCNHCGAQPIRGIRYHCLNCADYDLCDSCESLGDVHVKTHCFIKIRVPLAPHANLRGAGAPVMYPGKEITSGWNKDDLMTSLLESKLFELIELQALFEQFLALATVPPTDTEPGGITRETFDLCLGPLGKEKNLITDRIFSFFDQDSDNIISFKEFVLGLGVMIKGSLDERISYAFKGYDIDSDGRISRQELHRMFKAYFYLSMQLVRDYVKTVEQDMMDTFDDEAAKPVSASFTAPIPSSGGSADDEDQSHTKIRGYEGTISGSSRPNTAPSSSADVAAVFSSAGANSDSSPSFTESSPLVQATQTSSSSSSTSLPRPADEQQLPVIEAMSQDAIEEMVERTFTAADAADPNYITLDEFKRAVELDHSYLQWFEALGSVF